MWKGRREVERRYDGERRLGLTALKGRKSARDRLSGWDIDDLVCPSVLMCFPRRQPKRESSRKAGSPYCYPWQGLSIS